MLLRNHHPEIFGLLEPKVSGAQADRICKNIGYDYWIRVEAFGYSGGIWVFWQNNLHVDILATHPQLVLLKVAKEGESPVTMAFVYASPSYQLRRKLWNDLKAQKLHITDPWVSIGDFNSVLTENDTSNNRSFASQRCVGFAYWIFEEGLLDMGYSGHAFTWTRGNDRDTWKAARLDRALCDMSWRLRFKEATVEHLPRVGSDHCPILLRTSAGKNHSRTLPFRFQTAWLTHPKFEDEVKRCWKNTNNLATNKRNLACALKDWNVKEFGNIFHRKNRLMARISGVQRRLDQHQDKGLIKLEARLRKELDVVLTQEELHWYQKSREDWIYSADRNTRFYHFSAAIKKSRRKIRALKDVDEN